MKLSTLATSAAIMLGLTGATQAELIGTNDSATILGIAQQYGSAEPTLQVNGDPQITGQIDGITYQIYFLNCTANAKCEDLNFYLGFLDIKPGLDVINSWNFNKRFSRAYLDQDQDASIEMDVDMAHGVDRAFLDAQFAIWRQLIDQFASHIGYR